MATPAQPGRMIEPELPATAAAAAVTTATTATTAAATALTGLGNVHGEVTTLNHLTVETADGGLGSGVAAHLDEAEAARTARLTVRDNGGAADGAEGGEQLRELVVSGVEGEVSDVELVLGHGPLAFE